MIENHGVKLGRRYQDYIGGTLAHEVRIADGNWRPFLPPGEWQKFGDWSAPGSVSFDSMACVTFSLLNCLETQEFFLTGKKVNYSDRWIAKMSNTTKDGNYLYLVADAVRKYGLVLESSWPVPATLTWDAYYATPDPATMQKLLLEGQQWLTTHQFAYEWLTTSLNDILKHLKHTPLQVVIPGHAIENFFEESEVVNYFDSYSPFEKQTTRGKLLDVLKPLLTIKRGDIMFIYHKQSDQNTQYVLTGDTLIGFGDLPAYQKFVSGKTFTQVELSDTEFAKFPVSPVVIKT
jgi:hypothetical protein